MKFLLITHQKVNVPQLYFLVEIYNRYSIQNGKLVYSDILFLVGVRWASGLLKLFENGTEMETVRAIIVIVFIAGTCKNQLSYVSLKTLAIFVITILNTMFMAQYFNVGKALRCYKCVSFSDSCVTDRNVKGTEVECGNATSQTCMKIQGSKSKQSIAWILVLFGK